MQAANGLSPISKEVVLPDGRVCHPTKGFRGKNRADQEGVPQARPERTRAWSQGVIAKLSNWQRTRYSVLMSRARAEGIDVTDEDFRLELAKHCEGLKRHG